MKILRFIGKLSLTPLRDRFEGVCIFFGSTPAHEHVTRFNAVVTIGQIETGQITSMQITFGQLWDGNGIETFLVSDTQEPNPAEPLKSPR